MAGEVFPVSGLFSTSLATRSCGSVRRASQRFRASEYMTVPLRPRRPFGVPPRSATNKAGCIVACWPTSASGSRWHRSRLVDSLPSWRTGLVASVSLNRTVSPRPLSLLCHAVLVMSGDQLVVSGPVPVRIRPSPWLFTGGLRRSCPRAARIRVVFRGHSSASRPPARQVPTASLSPLSSLCGLHCLVRGQHINSN